MRAGGLATILLLLATVAIAAADESQWSQVGVSTPPSARQSATMIYDPNGQRMILFGGTSSNADGSGVVTYSDVWVLNLVLGVWISVSPSGTPPSGRYGHTAIYDPGRPGTGPRMLVYGGYGSDDNIHALSLTGTMTWSTISVPGPYKADHVAVYDSQHDQMIVSGGYPGYGDAASTYAFNLSTQTWTALPSAANWIDRASAVWDPVNQRMLVMGGVLHYGASCPDGVSDVSVNQVLSLSWPGGTPTWTTLPNAPWSARAKLSAVFDGLRNRVMIFGGSNLGETCSCGGLICPYVLIHGESPNSDVWAFSSGGTWSQLQPTGGPPPARGYQAAAYSIANDRMVVFGGGDNQETPNCVSQTCLPTQARSFRNDKWDFRPDAVAPGAITSLGLDWTSPSGAGLFWTAPGDDGNTGTATSYDLRYSTSPITSGNFTSATPVSPQPVPHVAGSGESYDVAGLASCRTYYFAIKARDEAGNVSAFGNTVNGQTLCLHGQVNTREEHNSTAPTGPLLSVSPNPSRGPVDVQFEIPDRRTGTAVLEVLDVSGRRIRILWSGASPQRVQSATWDRRDDAGNAVSPGRYQIQLRSGDAVLRQSVTVVR